MRSTGSLGTRPIRTADAGGQVAAERAGQQHLLDVAVLEAELLEQQRPAGRDRGLGELQLAHVALGEVRRTPRPVGVGRRAGAARTPAPRRSQVSRSASAGAISAATSSVTNRPEASSSPTRTSSATASTRPGAAQAARLDVADHLQLDAVLVGVELDHLDRAVGGAHAAADRAALERRARPAPRWTGSCRRR